MLTILLKKLIIGEKELSTNNAVYDFRKCCSCKFIIYFLLIVLVQCSEAEVYAMATFLIALLFWLGLRWEQEINTPSWK